MKIYEYRDQRVLDPYQRIYIGVCINRIFQDLSKGDISCIRYSIGDGILITYVETKGYIRIRCKLCYGKGIAKTMQTKNTRTRTVHLNPFRHKMVSEFYMKTQKVYHKMRQFIKSDIMMIPLGVKKVDYKRMH